MTTTTTTTSPARRRSYRLAASISFALFLALGLLGLAAFLWALRSGQYDDLDGAALRVLSDDDLAP